MSSNTTKYPSEEELRARRMLPPEDVIEYAKVAIENPEVVQLIREQITENFKNDGEAEDNMARLFGISEKYLEERGQSLRKSSALKVAYLLIYLRLSGKTDSFESEECLQVLKNAHYVDFGEER